MKKVMGIPASSGIATGKAFRIKNPLRFDEMENRPASVSVDLEIKQLTDAAAVVKARLRSYMPDSRIFAAHLEMLDDLTERVISKIGHDRVDAVCAINETGSEIYALFAEIEDEYLRSRADDIVDICRQLILALEKNGENPFSAMPERSILIVDNLLVSDTLLIDKSKLAGIALRNGSRTSHVAIMARDKGIPMVVGIGNGIDDIPADEVVIIDGDTGVITTGIEETNLLESVREATANKADSAPAITKDGVAVKVYANAGSLVEVEKAIALGADGIGLLRTEFIFMQGTDFPDEAMQQEIYLECAKACRGKILTVRTLDTGADKPLPYMKATKEENPVFGLRGIRFSLACPDIFKVQLRAILRASTMGNVRIMFPMITSLDEYRIASALLEACKSELKAEGTPCDHTLRAGIMIETPASVMLADDFARTAPFFSIGTNDLTQYMLAVDRNTPYAEHAFDCFHSAVVKSISAVMAASVKHATDVSVCGEMASDMRATELLLQLGVANLSVASHRIHAIKEQIRKLIKNHKNL